jgi:hypothetical protein
MTIEKILVLPRGLCPHDDLNFDPGELPGPWGATAEEALATLAAQSDLVVGLYWLRGSTLWVESVGP